HAFLKVKDLMLSNLEKRLAGRGQNPNGLRTRTVTRNLVNLVGDGAVLDSLVHQLLGERLIEVTADNAGYRLTLTIVVHKGIDVKVGLCLPTLLVIRLPTLASVALTLRVECAKCAGKVA